MAIKKQEFYEGAALHLLARTGLVTSIRYDPPLFLLNGKLLILMKYSARGRSPWAFTFTSDEQELLRKSATQTRTTIALICGADGVAALTYDKFQSIAVPRKTAVH